jgi:hypothetical protein
MLAAKPLSSELSGIMPLANPSRAYNAGMKGKILPILVCVWLLALGLAKVSDEPPQELIGIWDYTSLTISSGATVHFKPGQWTLKLNADATWVMQGPIPNAKPATGT